jgi:hypothetical protein
LVVSTAGHRTVVAKVNALPSKIPLVPFYGSVELDTHADTCVAGKNFIVLSFNGREAVQNIPIVLAATAIQHPNSGETLILVFNEVLWYGDRMDHSLINPNQLRHFGVMVHDNPFDIDHPLMIKELSDGVFIPLQIKGTTVFFDSHTPTSDELENCPHIVLTSDNPWNLGTEELGCSDITVTGADVSMVSEELVSSADKVILAGISCVYYPVLLAEQLRVVSQVDVPRLRTFVSDKRHSAIIAPELSERWHFGNRQAKDTLAATTQKYTRSAILRSVSW